MFYCNQKMKPFIKQYKNRSVHSCHKGITKTWHTADGQKLHIFSGPFFCLTYDLKHHSPGSDLSEFEYNGNEYYLCAKKKKHRAVMDGMDMMISLKRELTRKYPDSGFTIILFVNEECRRSRESVQIRFYKDRNDGFTFPHRSIEEWRIPVLVWKSSGKKEQ